MKLNQFLKKCYEKEIVRSMTIFVVSCWTVIQVSQVTHGAVGLPQEFVSTLIILFFAITPFYIYRTWNRFGREDDYESLTEQGQQESVAFRSMYMKGLGLSSVLCVCLIAFVVTNKFFKQNEKIFIEKQRNTDKIAVLNFKNNTGHEENEVIGQMASDWISHGIVKEKVSQVISSDVINSYSEIVKANQINIPKADFLRKYLNPGQVITGSYFQMDNQLVFQVSLLDGENNELLFSFDDETCQVDSPLECIEKIKQVILSYYINENGEQISLEDYPPKFEAYKLMLKAKELNNFTSDEFIGYLNAAVEIDPNYFEPKVSRIGYYYNIGDYDEAKNQVDGIESITLETARQKNIVRVYERLLAGDNKGAYENMKKEFDQSPLDFGNNNSMIIMALQLVNRPELVENFSNQIDQELINTSDCQVCTDRVKMLMDSYLALNQPEQVITTYREYNNLQSSNSVFYPLATAYIQLGKKDLVLELLKEAKKLFSKEELELYSLHLYNQSQIFDFELDNEVLTPSNKLEVIANFTDKKYQSVINLVEDEEPGSLLIYKAAAYSRKGQTTKAKKIIDQITSEQANLDFGYINYQLARYYALVGDKDKMYSHLEASVMEGFYFTDSTYMNDSIFNEFTMEDQFQELLNYWK